MALLAKFSSQELLQAQRQLWHQSLGYCNSVALVVALNLRIADAVHRLGGGATLPEILAEIGISPCKLPDLRRLMRALTISGVFSVDEQPDEGHGHDAAAAVVYRLTAASSLLLVNDDDGSSTTPSPPFSLILQVMLEPCRESKMSKAWEAWFRQEEQQPGLSPFSMAYGGQTIFERGECDAAVFPFNDAMASDTAFLMPIVLKECGEVFHGLTSLVDVAGGFGGAAAAIAAAFPDLKCTVLDLPQVVAKAPSGTNVQYVAGDMFESIPPANAVFLKWVLHDWRDDECVKILKNCKQAIPPRDAGGKIIIIDMVVGSGPPDIKHVETQVLHDLLMMNINGLERDEQEWRKIFFEAGFKDYKIIPVLGVRSIIELYP